MKLLLSILLVASAFISHAQSSPGSFTYVLQADALEKSKTEAISKLAACGRDWIILDAQYGNNEPWTSADLTAIKAGRAGRKLIAYISIGEAEDYRAYWNPKWDPDHDGKPDACAPAFLLTQNPEWKGNYRVKYWQADWQQIMLVQVDKIMAAGFDGVYLDIVDGFETFEQDGKSSLDDRVNPETKQSYRRDMVDWVKAVAARARKANPAALVIPQNGTQLLVHPDFLSTVDAVGIEDLFSNGEKSQKPSDTKYVLECVAPLIAIHKPALDIEYPSSHERRAKVQELAAQHGLTWIVTDRQLKTLGESGK
ncbi:MAG TPA: endo alpha-1,4 polygalactosaminidase [Verrucomicrobiae bacterium]|nr:endo alpha-1,4 polygalactosaminidase [Verrucomicrobiae bacterium]